MNENPGDYKGFDNYVRILELKKLRKNSLENFLLYLSTEGWESKDSCSLSLNPFSAGFHYGESWIKLCLNGSGHKNNRIRLLLHNNSGAEDLDIADKLFKNICDYLDKNKIKYEEFYKEG